MNGVKVREATSITDEDREHARQLAREHRATWQAEGRLAEKERRVWRLINDITRGN